VPRIPSIRLRPLPAPSRRGRRLRVATVVAVGAALTVPVSANAASDQFLKLAGSQYKGESLDQHFVDAIEVQSSSFAIKRSAPVGAPTFGNLTITKHVDRSSPALMLAAASGAAIPSARLSVRKAAGMTDGGPYLEYCFQNVVVMSDALETGNGDERPSETVTFRYLKATQSYFSDEGTGSAPIVTGWSLVNSTPISVFPTTCGSGSSDK
jgi:type VI secretion system secreted protein Hcp